MGRLRNLQVERADAVGSPATGHKWVILKSSNEAVEKAAAIEKAAGDALSALIKEAGLTFSKETVDALKALAAALEVDGAEFTVKSDEDAPEDTDVEKDDDENDTDAEDESGDESETDDENADDDTDELDDENVEKETFTRDEAEELVKAALTKFGVDVDTFMKGADLGTSRLAVAKSRQPKDADTGNGRRAVKKGDGVFTNVIFGQD